MKSYILMGALAVAVGVAGLVFFTVRERAEAPEVACTMEARQCPDGSYVGRMGPNCEFAACPDMDMDEDVAADDMIVIEMPRPGAIISSPVAVSGRARGNWFFEGSAPVTVVNWDGLIIGEGYMTAEGEWMTTDFVPFSGTITYTIDPDTPYDRGTIIFKKDNPSGLPEHDDAREIPVRFGELGAPGTAATDPGLGEAEPVFCTLDAKQCPDGSYVGRIGPNCEFAPCP